MADRWNRADLLTEPQPDYSRADQLSLPQIGRRLENLSFGWAGALSTHAIRLHAWRSLWLGGHWSRAGLGTCPESVRAKGALLGAACL